MRKPMRPWPVAGLVLAPGVMIPGARKFFQERVSTPRCERELGCGAMPDGGTGLPGCQVASLLGVSREYYPYPTLYLL